MIEHDPTTHYIDPLANNGGGGSVPWQDETVTEHVRTYREWADEQRRETNTHWWTPTAPTYRDILDVVAAKDEQLVVAYRIINNMIASDDFVEGMRRDQEEAQRVVIEITPVGDGEEA